MGPIFNEKSAHLRGEVGEAPRLGASAYYLTLQNAFSGLGTRTTGEAQNANNSIVSSALLLASCCAPCRSLDLLMGGDAELLSE